MVADSNKKILKYILVSLNFPAFLSALSGVIGSAVLLAKPEILTKLSDIITEAQDVTSFLSPASIRIGLYVILAVSVLMLIISFLGWCAAWKEIKCLLILYATLLFIIFAVEVAVFVVAIVFKDKVESHVKNALTVVKKLQSTTYGEFEKMLGCCGVEDGDFCVTPKLLGPKIGCYNKIENILKEIYPVILAVGIITAIIEIILICFACCLCAGLGENIA